MPMQNFDCPSRKALRYVRGAFASRQLTDSGIGDIPLSWRTYTGFRRCKSRSCAIFLFHSNFVEFLFAFFALHNFCGQNLH